MPIKISRCVRTSKLHANLPETRIYTVYIYKIEYKLVGRNRTNYVNEKNLQINADLPDILKQIAH